MAMNAYVPGIQLFQKPIHGRNEKVKFLDGDTVCNYLGVGLQFQIYFLINLVFVTKLTHLSCSFLKICDSVIKLIGQQVEALFGWLVLVVVEN